MSTMCVITGNKGFIGTNLTKMTGWDGLDIGCDVRDISAMRDVLLPHDVVIHLAGLAGVKRSMEIPDEYEDVNVMGTRVIAQVCAEQGKRLLFASSSSVYECKSPYAKSKLKAERAIKEICPNHVIMRFFTVFGEYNRRDMAVYKFTQAIRRGEPIELYGDCYRDFTYVQDLCRAIAKLAKMRITGTYDLGFGDSIAVIDLIRALEKEIGKEADVTEKPARGFDAVETKADSKLMESLTQKTPLDIALRNTLKTI